MRHKLLFVAMVICSSRKRLLGNSVFGWSDSNTNVQQLELASGERYFREQSVRVSERKGEGKKCADKEKQ